jgi:type IV pilus assembly protein PilB
MDTTKNIGDLLLEYGMINNDALQEGLKYQKQMKVRLGEALIRLGKVTEDDIEWILSKQLDIPFVIVENITPDPKLIARFSKEFLLRNRIFPLYETDDDIAIATDDPLNRDAFSEIENTLKKKVRISSGNGNKIEEILTGCFSRESIPFLLQTLKDILAKLEGTCFYRIDFILSVNRCRVNIFGSGILRNMADISVPYTKEDVFAVFDFLNIPFAFDFYSNQGEVLLSVYPLMNRIEAVQFPAIIGLFGLLSTGSIVCSDIHTSRSANLFATDSPVTGYPFICTKGGFVTSDKTVFTTDSAPREFREFYVNMAVPQACDSCRGAGCADCRDTGYVFSRRIEGIYSSEEINGLLDGVWKWQR